ncbi:MAG: tetratricopeptide repeat protein, partial [candidate division WOR-3 bacterium]|nr:tetratricopeptide repeat protein [candidate division WOR-3 bacterium]
LGAKQEQASVLGNIGLVWQSKGEWDKALEYQEKALAIDRELGSRQGEAQDLGNIGSVYVGMMMAAGGDSSVAELPQNDKALTLAVKAVPKLAQALAMFLKLGAGDGPRQCRSGLGKCLKVMGRDKFVATCEKAGIKKEEAEELAEALARPD